LSYLSIDQLTQDHTFQGRVRACTVQEAERLKDDQRPDWVALALDCLRGGGASTLAFVRIIAAFPGIVAEAGTGLPDDNGPPRFDQSTISDGTILSQVQTQWEHVAALFWDDDGNRREVT
jgi:hypothetical protein